MWRPKNTFWKKQTNKKKQWYKKKSRRKTETNLRQIKIKRNIPKHTACSKSSPKREAYLNKYLH